jgi:hypothetical protein
LLLANDKTKYEVSHKAIVTVCRKRKHLIHVFGASEFGTITWTYFSIICFVTFNVY